MQDSKLFIDKVLRLQNIQDLNQPRAIKSLDNMIKHVLESFNICRIWRRILNQFYFLNYADVVDFKCPEVPQVEGSSNTVVANPLYPDPDSCQFFYVCINNKEPRRNGCPQGSVFNPLAKKCDHPKNVPEWYESNL